MKEDNGSRQEFGDQACRERDGLRSCRVSGEAKGLAADLLRTSLSWVGMRHAAPHGMHALHRHRSLRRGNGPGGRTQQNPQADQPEGKTAMRAPHVWEKAHYFMLILNMGTVKTDGRCPSCDRLVALLQAWIGR